MRIIISTTIKDEFSGFKVVTSFKEVRDYENVSLLVINEFNESDFDAGVFITEFYQSRGIKNFIYINERPREAVKTAIVGVSGKTYEDTFYLEDEEELLALAEEVEEERSTELSTVYESAEIVRDFIKRFATGDEAIKAPLYLEQVENALNELSTTTQQQREQIMSMGNSAIKTFERANNVIAGIAEQKKKLELQLNTLMNEKPAKSMKTNQLGGNILFFPTVPYTGTAKMLFIRELSPCRYLTSWMLAYEHYLHYERNKRVKLIFVHQKGYGVAKRYESFCSITQESMHSEILYDENIIATNNPKQEVMRKLFSKQTDIFIVVDRLYGKNDIVTGRVNKLNAIGGRRDLRTYGVKPETCISSSSGNNNAPDSVFYNIPSIGKYPTDPDTQKIAYIQCCPDSFKKLDALLGI